MSLLDTFRPKWQNSNPDKRLEAIDELDAQDTLERIALSDENNDVRAAAIRKLKQIPVLLQISKNDSEASIRRLSEARYFEEVAKMLKEFREPANDEVKVYLNDIKDTRYAEELVKSMPSSELRMELVRYCQKLQTHLRKENCSRKAPCTARSRRRRQEGGHTPHQQARSPYPAGAPPGRPEGSPYRQAPVRSPHERSTRTRHGPRPGHA